MSSSMYIGPPGVGKTLSLVRNVIVPALKEGQRVVTNTPLFLDKLAAYLGLTEADINELVVLVDEDDINSPRFWFSAENVGETLTKPGDIIIIDEAHAFFGSDKKIKSDSEVFRAIRLQRKYTGGRRNFSTNIIFATQLYEDLHRSIRNVCDSMYFMQRLTVVGKPDSYRVDVYADCRSSPTRARPVSQLFGDYESEYFGLYNSYSTGVGGFESKEKGTELISDDRLNIWNSTVGWGIFKMTLRTARRVAVVFSVLMFTALPLLLLKAVSDAQETTKLSTQVLNADEEATPASASTTAPTLPVADKPVAKSGPTDSPKYRLVGIYSLNGVPTAVVADERGTYRYLQAFEFTHVQRGPGTHILYEDSIVATWTGVPVAIRGSTPKTMETTR